MRRVERRRAGKRVEEERRRMIGRERGKEIGGERVRERESLSLLSFFSLFYFLINFLYQNISF